MDYNEAISTLEGEVLEAISGHVNKLTKGDQKVKGLLKTLGVTLGTDDGDPLETVKKAISELSNLKENLEETTKKLNQTTSELSKVKHDSTLATACQTVGVNRKVLESLPGFDPSKLEVTDGNVLYSGKTLLDTVESDELWRLFKPSLVNPGKPDSNPEVKPEVKQEAPKLPVGGGKPSTASSALTDWLNKRYQVPTVEKQ